MAQPAAPGAKKSAKMRMEDFEVQGVISKGSFGVVSKLVRKSDGRVFALKQVELKGLKMEERYDAIDEARMLAQLQHPYVTRHYDSFIDAAERLNIIMEYASGGSLNEVIKRSKKGLPEEQVWKYLLQALVGLSYIHSKRIIHRDMKSLNLFLDSKDNIKIGDLGIARALSDGSINAHTIVGTPYYLAPEQCNDKPYNEKSDIWALGVIMYECCTGRYPFEARQIGALVRKIMDGRYDPISGPYSTALVQVVSSCLTQDQKKRPDTIQLLRSPSIVAKAKALGIDLNPKPVVQEDEPVFDQPQAAAPAAAPSPVQPAMAAQQAMAAQHKLAQQQGLAHPFEAAPKYGTPPPPHQPGHPFNPAEQHAAAAAANAALPDHPQYDQMVDEARRMQVKAPGQHPFAAGAKPPPAAAPPAVSPLPAAARDNMKGVLAGNYDPNASMPGKTRPRPEDMPAAGVRRVEENKAGVLPMGPMGFQRTGGRDVAMEASAWGATYERPTYGRRRNPDLMAAGPGLRGAGGGGAGASRGAGYVPVADDATTYISSTSYYR